MSLDKLYICIFVIFGLSSCSDSPKDSQGLPHSQIEVWLDSLSLAYDNNQWGIVSLYCDKIWKIDSLYNGLEAYYAQSLIGSNMLDSAINYLSSVINKELVPRYDLLQIQAFAYYIKGDIEQSSIIFDRCISGANASFEYVESVVRLYEEDKHHKEAIHFRERALMKLYKSNVRIEEKLSYAAYLDSIDPGNKVADYVHEQILPKGSDVYLPGFDDDVDDVHDMELFFSDPYF